MLDKSIIKQYKISYDECKLSPERLIKLLGYDIDSVPYPVLESVTHYLENLPQLSNLQGGFKIFEPKNVLFSDYKFFIENRVFNCEKIIYSNLRSSDTIAFLVSTIGSDLELKSRDLTNRNELLGAYILDRIGSELVECVADKIQILLQRFLETQGLKTTNRYSPGYCGWNVQDQNNLFSLLPEDFCSIRLNEYSMMIPVKSISAVIGIGSRVEQKIYDCSACEEDFCYKRERDA